MRQGIIWALSPGEGEASVLPAAEAEMGDYCRGDTGEIYSGTMRIRAGLARAGASKADLARACGRLQIVADFAARAAVGASEQTFARREDKSTLRSGMGL
jgi:hypothetical protein